MKNTQKGISNRLQHAGEEISDLEDQAVESNQAKEQKGKKTI